MTKGFRIVLLIAVVGAIVTLGAGVLLAADGEWTAVPLDKNFRGPGGYLSWIKILACWLLFLLWVHTTDWVSTDCQELKLDYLRWNPIVFGTFMAAMVLLWLIPYFWVGFPLLVIAYAAPLATYIVLRNKQVDNNLRVMTPEHLRYWFATKLNKIGVKVAAERRDPHELGAPVKLLPFGGPDERTDNARLLLARQSPGLGTAREILAEGLAGRASAIMLDYTQQGVAVRTMIDGVWIPREARPRETGDPALESLKLLCGLNPKDRQNRQAGTFAADYESARYTTIFTSQGTPGGERVLLQFEEKKIHFKTLDELGMRTKLQEQLLDLLRAKQGFVLFSAPPGGGLRSTMDVTLRACDRYTREFVAVEEEKQSVCAGGEHPGHDLQGGRRPVAGRRAGATLPHRAERGGRPRPGQCRDGPHVVRRDRRESADDRHRPGEGQRRGPVAGVGAGRAAGRVCQGRHGGGQSAVGAQAVRGAAKRPTRRRPRSSSSWAFPPAASRHSTGRGSRTPRSRRKSAAPAAGSATWAAPRFSRCWRSATQSARH